MVELVPIATIGRKQFFRHDTNRTVFYIESVPWDGKEFGYVGFNIDKSGYVSNPVEADSLEDLKHVKRYGSKDYLNLIKMIRMIANEIEQDKLEATVKPYDFLYKKYINELKREHTNEVMNAAIRSWKVKGLSDDEISDKIDDLHETLARASKEQFIAIYKTYKKGGGVMKTSMSDFMKESEDSELVEKKPAQVPEVNQYQLLRWVRELFSPKVYREEELDFSGAKELTKVQDPMGTDTIYQMNDGHITVVAKPYNLVMRTNDPISNVEQVVDDILNLLPLAQEMFGSMFGGGQVPRKGTYMKTSMSDFMKESVVWKKGDLQSKIPKLVKRYVDKQVYTNEQEAIDRINLLSQADPTGSRGEYIDWLIKLDLAKSSVFPEDIDMIKETLIKYDRAKNTGIDIDKNIFSFDTHSKLEQALEGVFEEDAPIEKLEKERAKRWFKETGGRGIEEVYVDSTYTVYKITDAEALKHLCWLKAPAKYCVMNIEWAQSYIKGGPFYIMFKGNDIFLNLVPYKREIWTDRNAPASVDKYWEVRDVILAIPE